jgi:hypothetical protein
MISAGVSWLPTMAFDEDPGANRFFPQRLLMKTAARI